MIQNHTVWHTLFRYTSVGDFAHQGCFWLQLWPWLKYFHFLFDKLILKTIEFRFSFFFFFLFFFYQHFKNITLKYVFFTREPSHSVVQGYSHTSAFFVQSSCVLLHIRCITVHPYGQGIWMEITLNMLQERFVF